MRIGIRAFVASVVLVAAVGARAEEEKSDAKLQAGTYAGLEFRSIGPAQTSGRIADFAVVPGQRSSYYVAVASGGVWKTTNAGTTWKPIFDGEDSYSIGCVSLDPNDPLVVWVGTGENNSQRSVGYGDGVYKSIDGGQTWKNVGLKDSEHIAKILIDPRDSDVVYVAAQGPLWSAGGDRGLYKTTDGGETWEAVLEISEDTGVTDVVFDPRDPDVLYAAAYQRRRHVWTLIDGGPESALYKSTDAGASWRKLTNGLPKADLGRIGLAVSPADPDVVYAVVEAAEERGFYRSTNAGGSFERMGDYTSGAAMYYNEIFADPKRVDRVYSMDTFLMVTEDGGKSFSRLGEADKHVDNHAMWIDPEDTDYLLVGCDGGIYESFDRGQSWHYKDNLPVTQFYRVTVDNAEPFYNVYGGTQDNATLGGPSRTTTTHGITNADWFVTVFGDGFETQVDPTNPDIVYSQWQYGGLVRHDRKTGEIVDIKPQPGPADDALRFNWDSPLLISPHSPTRLYFGAQRVFRSDDRGDSWRAVSEDLTTGTDRNTLPVMGRVWGVDAVAKHIGTTPYGNLVALTESPRVEDLLYAGTDDGLIQISKDGGESWRRVESVPGVPEMTYVNDLDASLHDDDTVFATFNNHKRGDFKPYVLKSTDRGRSWSSIAGNLPERGTAYALAEDHVDSNLLFVGTEFGVFFTPDGGGEWIQLEGGLPTIAVRDIDIQRRENDLALATFGRGFYILDDYSPLRGASETQLQAEAMLFEPRQALMFVPSSPWGLPGKAFQGASFYTAPNPPFGAVFTYYLSDSLLTKKEIRQRADRELAKQGKDVSYPSWEELRAEDREAKPGIVLTVRDGDGNVVRRIDGPTKKGFHRVAWDLRHPAANPTDLSPPDTGRPVPIETRGPARDAGAVHRQPREEGGRSIRGARRGEVVRCRGPRHTHPGRAGQGRAARVPEEDSAPAARGARIRRGARGDRKSHRAPRARARGHPGRRPVVERRAARPEGSRRGPRRGIFRRSDRRKRSEPSPPGISRRVNGIVRGHWSTTGPPTETHREAYAIAAGQFAVALGQLRNIAGNLGVLEDRAEAAGAPWTPGRLPTWTPEGR